MKPNLGSYLFYGRSRYLSLLCSGVTGRRSRPSARRVRSRRLPLAGALPREAGLDRDDVRAVAAGIPGPLDRQRRVISSPILSSRTGFADELAGCLGQPVDIGSDADMGAIGEERLGAARVCDLLLYERLARRRRRRRHR